VRTALAAVLALAGAARAQEPEFGGRRAAEWRLLLADANDRAELAGGGAEAVPVVLALLRDPDQEVVQRALLVAEELRAPELVPVVLAALRGSDAWWTRLHAARALGRMRARAPAVSAALLEACVDPAAAHLRQVAADALFQTTDDAAARLLDKAAQDESRRALWITALVAGGERAVPALVAALPVAAAGAPAGARAAAAADARGDAARRALARIGWPALQALEGAGRADLVPAVLQGGVVERAAAVAGQSVRFDAPAFEVERLPVLEWEVAGGHAQGWLCARAAEVAAGVSIDRIQLEVGDDGELRTVVATAIVPRARAAALARQLAVLFGSRMVTVPGPQHGTTSTGDVHTRVVVTVDGKVAVDERWAGYPADARRPQSYHTDCARAFLAELTANATFTERAPTAADLELGKRQTCEAPEWVAERRARIVADLTQRLGTAR